MCCVSVFPLFLLCCTHTHMCFRPQCTLHDMISNSLFLVMLSSEERMQLAAAAPAASFQHSSLMVVTMEFYRRSTYAWKRKRYILELTRGGGAEREYEGKIRLFVMEIYNPNFLNYI